MKPPFDAAQFFGVFARYNEAVWPMQLVLAGAALACLALVFSRRPAASRLIAGILGGLWIWMGFAYHFAFFTAINPAAWLFGAVFVAGAAAILYLGVWRAKLRFATGPRAPAIVGWGLIGYALLIYPAIGFLLGHHYPEAPTFGLPCPTTIFTLGMLGFAAAPAPAAVFVVPLLWSLIGSFAALEFGVFQDFGLILAGVLSVAGRLAPG